MRKTALAAAIVLFAGAAAAQTAPPTEPTGRTPPGTPTTATVPGQISRNSTAQGVIGQTATPPSAVPGNTGGEGSGGGGMSK